MFSFIFSVFQYTAIFRKRKSFYPIPAIAVSSFSTPASAITSTGFHFVSRRRIRQITKIPTITQRVSASAMTSALFQKADTRIDTPADAIIATTAGRRDCKTLCNRSIF